MMTANRILIVDDDPGMIAALERNFKTRFNLITAQSGKEALAHSFTDLPVSVVVADMRMPGMDGLQLLRQIKTISPDTVRIMLTGNADQKTAVDAINEGSIFRFYCKPCPHDTLAAGIEDGIEEFNRVLQQVEENRQKMEAEVKARTADLKSEVLVREQLSAELQAILDNMAETLYRTDADGIITMTSRSTFSLTGYTPDELVGKKVSDYYVAPDQRDDFISQIQAGGGKVNSYETPILHKEGHNVWVSGNAHLIYGSTGDVVGIEGTIRDITRQKENETRLIESEKAMREARKSAADAQLRLTTALNSLEAAFSLYDADDKFVLCNDVYRKFYKKSIKLLAPGNTFEAILRSKAECGEILIAQGQIDEWVAERMAFRHAGKSTYELELSDGRWLKVSTHPTPDGGMVSFQVDITVLKDSYQALRESEEKLRDYADTSADWFWDMDADLRFNGYSGNIAKYGLNTNDLIGKKRWELSDFDVVDEKWRQHRDDLENHRPFRDFEYALLRPYDDVLHVTVSGNPVFDKNGAFLGYRGTTKDVTEIKRLQDDLKMALKEAEAANKAKSSFLASMSHEIRTPMTGVMGFADMLLEDRLPEESREKVHRIKDSTQSLLSILNEILDLTKLEAGKVIIENLDFHLPALINQVIDLFKEKRDGDGRKDLEVSVLIAENLPKAIYSDPTRLRQLLINLTGNAVKFTDKGRVTLKAGLVGDKKSPMLRFDVTDTGIGIAPENMSKLFSAYTQAEASTSRKYQGSGLGLSICKKLVKLMGGEIGVESTFGEGSTFWFTLPFKEASSEVSEEPNQPGAHFVVHRELKILAAEDNRFNQRIIMAMMVAHGHSVDIAEDGAKAVEAHRAGEYDLILMDIRMPELSGTEATRRIRGMSGDKAHIPIIALTADAMTENRKEYLEAGMNEVVTKPFHRRDVLKAINKVMAEDIHVSVTPGGRPN